MEKYKLVLKKRIIILAGLIILAVILQICTFNNVFGIAGREGFNSGTLTGFIYICWCLFKGKNPYKIENYYFKG